jgi:DNA-directed RNA polymerase subunit L
MEPDSMSEEFKETGNQVFDVKHYYYPRYKLSDPTNPILCREKVSFKWTNTNLAFVNGLRRVIYSDIPIKVLGNFEFYSPIPASASQGVHPFEFSKIMPVMHNEQLTLALQLIPISQEYDSVVVCLGYKCVESKLVIEEGYCNTTKTIEDITTDHINVYQLGRDGRVLATISNDIFFPRKVLITKLKKYQRIGFKCGTVCGTGKINAMFQAVCSASFSYDEEQEYQPDRTMYQNEYEKSSMVDQKPTCFYFFVHALPYYTPEKVLYLGLDTMIRIMSDLLKKFNQMVDSYTDKQQPDPSLFTITSRQIVSPDHYQTFFEFFLRKNKRTYSVQEALSHLQYEQDDHEITYGHTIANILQHYLCRNPLVVFAAFVNDHPKVEELRCRVIMQGSPNIFEFLQTISMAIGHVVSDCNLMKQRVSTTICPLPHVP